MTQELCEEDLEEIRIMAEELCNLNFFMVSGEFAVGMYFIATYRTADQVKEIQGSVSVMQIQLAHLIEILYNDIIFCPELGAEYKEICTLLYDLKVAKLAGVVI